MEGAENPSHFFTCPWSAQISAIGPTQHAFGRPAPTEDDGRSRNLATASDIARTMDNGTVTDQPLGQRYPSLSDDFLTELDGAK